MRRIEAAGGVLWRPGVGRLGVELALVHRRGRNGWSLPKGVLTPGEHPMLGALREVYEETGRRGRLGPGLGSVHYPKRGVPKRVRYWSLAAISEESAEFAPNREIDDVVWLPPDAAVTLARRRDRPVINRFWRTRADRVRPLLLVRPATLVPRASWPGPADDRPLDPRGRRQASAIADLLRAFDVRRVLTSDLRCCTETVQPFEAGFGVAKEPVLPAGSRKPLLPALGDLSTLAAEDAPVAVCAKQRDLARLSREIAAAAGRRSADVPDLRPGGVLAMHVHASGRTRVLPERIPVAG